MNEIQTTDPTNSEAEQVRTLYPMRAAAKLVGIGYPALMGAAKAGTLRTVRVGRDYRVTARALNELIEGLEAGKIHLP